MDGLAASSGPPTCRSEGLDQHLAALSDLDLEEAVEEEMGSYQGAAFEHEDFRRSRMSAPVQIDIVEGTADDCPIGESAVAHPGGRIAELAREMAGEGQIAVEPGIDDELDLQRSGRAVEGQSRPWMAV